VTQRAAIQRSRRAGAASAVVASGIASYLMREGDRWRPRIRSPEQYSGSAQ
jgi:hypothetical protein